MGGFNSWLNLTRNVVFSFVCLLALGTQVSAEATFDCKFVTECPSNEACVDDPQETMVLQNTGEPAHWVLAMNTEDEVIFDELELAHSETRTFITKSLDADASAVGMLSVFTNGQAFLSIHGIFLMAGSVTHLGTCVPGDG